MDFCSRCVNTYMAERIVRTVTNKLVEVVMKYLTVASLKFLKPVETKRLSIKCFNDSEAGVVIGGTRK